MTTFNIATNFPTGKFHKRQSGLWGQLRASAEIEAKQTRVEPLLRNYMVVVLIAPPSTANAVSLLDRASLMWVATYST